MGAMRLYAESERMQYLIPLYTDFFSPYQQPANGPIPASFYQNSTPVFYAYKNITR
ncbi:MAG: hypothetical protein M1286_01075 [Candidatus Marsarchaeota archaeon]|nr:hypothetical protein [Candidatus Marsarchaeota archaeon]